MERPWAPARPGLSLLLTITAGLNLLPFAALLAFSLQGGNGVLGIGNDGLTQLSNTVLLVLLVGIGVACLGTAIGWLTACCNFAGKRWLTLAQLLPLATPAYLQAAVLTDLGAREGVQIHGLGWCVAVLTLANVPYVVLLARDNFRLSGRRQLEASRSLGLGAWKSFFRVSLPLAIPAITAGVALAGMEVVNEYGAVELLALPTLSTDYWSAGKGKTTPEPLPGSHGTRRCGGVGGGGAMATPQEPAVGHGRPHRCQRRLVLQAAGAQRPTAVCPTATDQRWFAADLAAQKPGSTAPRLLG